MQVIDYIFIALGIFCIGWGIYSIVVQKFPKERTDLYTLESLVKYAKIEGILTIISGSGIIIAGLANSGVVLDKKFLYVGWVLVVIVLIIEFALEPKILKKVAENKEENK